MPIGKNSITKRVATPATSAPVKEENIAPELVATTAAPKAPAKKTTSAAAKKPASATAKKPAAATKSTAAKKPSTAKTAATQKETLTPPAEEPKKVDAAVIANIAPETVAAVIGHKENTGFEKVQIGEPMPVHLL